MVVQIGIAAQNDLEGGSGHIVGLAAFGAVLVGLAMRCATVALVEGPDGELVVRNVFTTRRVRWSDVTQLSVETVPGRGYSAVVAARSRRRRGRIATSATLTYSRSRSNAICAVLSQRASVRGISCELDPEKLKSRRRPR